MKLYHVLLLFWVVFVAMWCLNAARASNRKRK
jgi:hypothetical protein